MDHEKIQTPRWLKIRCQIRHQPTNSSNNLRLPVANHTCLPAYRRLQPALSIIQSRSLRRELSIIRLPIPHPQPLTIVVINAIILPPDIIRIRRRHVRMRRPATRHAFFRLEVIGRIGHLDPHTRFLADLAIALVLGPARPFLGHAGVQGNELVVDPAADGVAECVLVDFADGAGALAAADHVRDLLVVVGIAGFAAGNHEVARQGEASGAGLAFCQGGARLLDGNGKEGGNHAGELEEGECGIHFADDGSRMVDLNCV